MADKKQILFVHQNFPGQFKNLAPALIKEGYDVHAIGYAPNVSQVNPFPGLNLHQYNIDKGSAKNIEPLAAEFETKMIRAKSIADKCEELKTNGLNPNLIIAHPQWGETFFLRDVWPKTKILSYFEMHWRMEGSDIDFDQEFFTEKLKRFTMRKIRPRNAFNEIIYKDSDKIMTPTEYQKSTAPDYLKKDIEVVHDGIDTRILKPSDKGQITLGGKIDLTKKDKIISFINRNLEPQRGYHVFMRSVPRVLKDNPDVNILVIGGNDKGYGLAPPKDKTWKDIFYNEVKDELDESRVHFLGRVDYKTLIGIYQLTTLHVYLTYPFVLSWSVLEAMSCGSLILGSNTDPVSEVITDKKNGLLVDFFDVDKLSETMSEVIKNSKNFDKIRNNARNTIKNRYDLKTKSLPKQINIVKEMLS